MTTDKTPLELRVPLIEAMLSHVPLTAGARKRSKMLLPTLT